jgi:hypothetical protein
LLLAGCGGGSGGSAPVTVPSPVPSTAPQCAAATCATSSSAVSSNATAAQTIPMPSIAGASGSVVLPAGTQTATGTTLQVTLQTVPGGVAALQSAQRRASDVGSTNGQLYLVLTPSQTITLPAFPSFAFTVPASLVLPDENEYVAFYDAAQGGYRTVFGPATAVNGVVRFGGTSAPLTLVGGLSYVFVLYGIPAVVAGNPVPSPSSVGFNLTGQTQIVSVSEPNYAGGFTATSSNPAIVSVAAASATSFVLTAGASAGSATITVRDSAGRTSLVDAGVTLSFGVVR